jgi:hypothetical protein
MVLQSMFWIENTEFQVGMMRAFGGFDRVSENGISDLGRQDYLGLGGVSAGGSAGVLGGASVAPLGLPMEAMLSTLNLL